MTDGHRQRVGGVIGSRLLGEPEQRLDHTRNLILLGAPAATDRTLHLLRGVARARNAVLAGHEQDHAAGLTNGERGAHVLAEIQLLERHRVGFVLAHQRIDSVVDLGQAPLRRRLGTCADHAAVQRQQARAASLDDAVARVGQAGIYAEDDHGQGFCARHRTPAWLCLSGWRTLRRVSAEQIDFVAEGLLDGLEGQARAERMALLEQLAGEGLPLSELRRTTASGTIVYLAADRVIAGPERYTSAEVAELSGVEEGFLLDGRRAMGLPIPEPDERVYTDGELETARMTRIARDAGISDEDLLDLLRVLSRGLSQAAESIRELPLKLVLEPGISERDLASRYAEAAASLYPLVDPLVSNLLALHLRHATQSTVVGELERSGGQLPGSREVAVCFADLVGFTRLGEEVPPDELGRLAVRLEALATEVARPPVKLVKTIGDAAMLACPTAEPVLAAALDLIDAADSEGEDFPLLRAGAAVGLAVPRAGDWFGRPVNLASRITSVARPGSVLADRGVRESVDGSYRWSFAGERRLRGIRDPVRLFRARRLST